MRLPSTRTAAIVAGALVLATSWASAQTALTPEQILQLPLSPGAIALMVEHATHPGIADRLAAAVGDRQADIRAAAARVAFVTDMRGLVPQLAAALAVERVADPAVEQTRALASFGGPERDGAIVDAWSTLGKRGAWRAAAAYASARGPAAFAALPRLRTADPSVQALAAFLRAARPDVNILGTLADDALAARDATLNDAVWTAARDLGLELGDARLAAALQHVETPAIRVDAVTYLLRSWDGVRPLPRVVREALASMAPLSNDPTNARALVAQELAKRAAGLPSSRPPGWPDLLKRPAPGAAALLGLPSAVHLLTAQEQRLVRRALPHLEGRLPPIPPPAHRSDLPMMIQAIEAYPAGFLASVYSVSGCDARKAKREGFWAGAAELTLRRDGRAGRVSTIDTGLTQPGCVDATRILLMTHVAAVSPPEEGERRVVMVPFDLDVIACRAAEPPETLRPVPTNGTFLSPPKKTRHVDPVYPQSALLARVEGLLRLEATIGTTGCVLDLRVTQGADPRLDLAALQAVLGWQFSPTIVDGAPVPTAISIVMRFSVR